VIDQVVKLSDNMEFLITFLIILDKLLIHANTEQRLVIKEQLFRKNVFLLEKALTFVKKVTKVVRVDDYNKIWKMNSKPAESRTSTRTTKQQQRLNRQSQAWSFLLASTSSLPCTTRELLAHSNESLFYQDHLQKYRQSFQNNQDIAPQTPARQEPKFGQDESEASYLVEQATRKVDSGTRYTIGQSPYQRLPDQDEFEKMKKLAQNPPKDSELLSKFHSGEPDNVMHGRKIL